MTKRAEFRHTIDQERVRVGNTAFNKSEPTEPWHTATFTAEDLRLETFPPLSWFLPEIIPAEGVTLLCSRPKFGKSWLARLMLRLSRARCRDC
jgi:hypothetical protein